MATRASSPHLSAFEIEKLDKIIHKNMIFSSENDAYEKYNDYARRVGFSIRKDKTYYRADGSLRQRLYVCSKEGERRHNPDYQHVRKERKETRTGCMARMIIKNEKGSEFFVYEIYHHHNHDLATPKKSHLLSSQRSIKESQGAEINSLDDAGIAPVDGYRFMTKQAGGAESVGLTYVDYKNYLRKRREEEYSKGDGNAIMDYFVRKQIENPSFFYSVMFDDEDLITNIFWVDGMSVMDYSFFGDVVIFDTTYRINKYGRPFAPFVGVNHHRETVFFGCALLIDETTESFVWLFETWMKAMSNKAPKTIITDQCQAMANAISIVFPETVHRICVWHMCLNASKHLSHVYKDDKFKADFLACIYGFEQEDAFLSKWQQLLDDYDLGDNNWVANLFRLRHKWASVYGRDSFCADMTTTQRAESVNNLLKHFLHRKLSLTQFVHQYELVLESRRQVELKSDFDSSQAYQRLYVPSPMLKQVADAYTHAMFKEFEVEYKDHLLYSIIEPTLEGTLYTYKVSRGGGERNVTFNSSNEELKCSCRNFEFTGILCRHIIKVLYHINIHVIPERYILKRWSKGAKSGLVRDKDNNIILPNPNAKLSLRYNQLCQMAMKLVSKGSLDDELGDIAKSAFAEGLKCIEGVMASRQSSPKELAKTTRVPNEERINIAQGSERGRKTQARPLGCLEKNQSRKSKSKAQSSAAPENPSGRMDTTAKKQRRNNGENYMVQTTKDYENVRTTSVRGDIPSYGGTNTLGRDVHHPQVPFSRDFGINGEKNLDNSCENLSLTQLLQSQIATSHVGHQRSPKFYPQQQFGSTYSQPIQLPSTHMQSPFGVSSPRSMYSQPIQLPSTHMQPPFGVSSLDYRRGFTTQPSLHTNGGNRGDIGQNFIAQSRQNFINQFGSSTLASRRNSNNERSAESTTSPRKKLNFDMEDAGK